MRELIARIICLLVLCVVVALSLLFAIVQNAPGPRTAPEPKLPAAPQAGSDTPPAQPPQVAAGKRIFQEQHCSTCHSIGGAGNPRYPLDDVGSRRNPEELRDWVTGSGIARTELSPQVQRRKARYAAMAEEEMNALIVYLSSLKRAKQ